MLCEGKIREIVKIEDFKVEAYQGWDVQDLTGMVIMPGLVDLNVGLSEGASTVTKQALSGGVTTLASSDIVTGELYTNIAPLTLNSHPTPGSFGTKLTLNPEPSNLSLLLHAKRPVFINPEVKILSSIPLAVIGEDIKVEANEAQVGMNALTMKASKFTLESEDESSSSVNENETFNSDSGSDSDSDSEPEIIISDCLEGTIKKRVSLPLLNNEEAQQMKIVNSPRHFSVQVNTHKRIPLQDLPFIAKGVQVQHAYAQHVRNCPVEVELEGIKQVFKHHPTAPIHFSNVSSAEAFRLIADYKKDPSLQVTCETSTPYLYFSQNDIKPGDTRYKLSPPIRDYSNYKQLWQLLKGEEIDCISSFHQPVPPPQKFIGDFFKAKNGVLSVGFTLQALWTRLHSQVPRGEEPYYISLLSSVLAEMPAKVLGLETKGSIRVGKDADLVVWDPFCKLRIGKTFDRFSEMNPMVGEELYGTVFRVYLMGEVVFGGSGVVPAGKILVAN